MAYPGNTPSGDNPGQPAYSYPDQHGSYPPPPPQNNPYTPGTVPLPPYGQPAGGYGSYSVDAPYSGAPASGGPPASGPPASGPPTFGPPTFGSPTSGPPTLVAGAYGQPFPGDPAAGPAGPLGPAGPRPKRGVVVPILAGLLALFVIAAAILAGLFVDKSVKLNKAQQQISQQRDTIAQRDSDLAQTKQDLQAKADELTRVQQDLRGTQNDNAQNKHDKEVIGQCLTLVLQALDAANKGDKATFDSKIAAMKAPCDETDTILGLS